MFFRVVKNILLNIYLWFFQIEFFGRALRKLCALASDCFAKTSDWSLKFSHVFKKLNNTNPYILKLSRNLDFRRLRMNLNYYQDLTMRIENYSEKPLISIILPVYKTNYEFLEEAIGSVGFQIYDNWELCIVDDCSNDPKIDAIIEKFKAIFPTKVKYEKNLENVHISVTSNRCLKLATGEFIALLDHDDRLYPHSLAEVIRHIHDCNNPDILYSDERVIDKHGVNKWAVFSKPHWSPIFHLTCNYTTHLSIFRRSLVEQVGGFRVGFEGAQDHDLMLRAIEKSEKQVVHIPVCLYQWRAHEQSTAASRDCKPYALDAGKNAVAEALARRGIKAKVGINNYTKHYRLNIELPEVKPLVSIVIPSKNGYELIDVCLKSIYEFTTYEHFEVIISDNGTTDGRVLKLYKTYEEKYGQKFKVHLEPHPFNFGRQINLGVENSKGEYIVLLNNDTEVISKNWIEEMLQYAQLPQVGAVGAKLIDRLNRIQHAGVVGIGLQVAAHIFTDLDQDDEFYISFLNTEREVMAVTGACLMIARTKFMQIGMHNITFTPNGYGDVKLCLDLLRAGYSNVYTPYAVLFHDESKTRDRAFEEYEIRHLRENYSKEITNDPFWSSNLYLFLSHFTYADHVYIIDIGKNEFNFLLNNDRGTWNEKLQKMLATI